MLCDAVRTRHAAPAVTGFYDDLDIPVDPALQAAQAAYAQLLPGHDSDDDDDDDQGGDDDEYRPPNNSHGDGHLDEWEHSGGHGRGRTLSEAEAPEGFRTYSVCLATADRVQRLTTARTGFCTGCVSLADARPAPLTGPH